MQKFSELNAEGKKHGQHLFNKKLAEQHLIEFYALVNLKPQ